MKRVLCGALAVILAIGCLTGCQEGNDLNSTNESSQAVSSKPNPADKKESIDTSSRKNSSSASKKSSSPDNVHQDPVAESQISDIQKPEKPTQNNSTSSVAVSPPAESSSSKPVQPPATSSSISPATPEPTGETAGQKNAIEKAKAYLNVMCFSYQGLVSQLEFEGFTHEEAVYGVDRCGADWNQQALGKANSYLSVSAFSRQGLVDQLIFDQFTPDQASFGVGQCGADWNYQASKKAAQYLELMAFSREQLIAQLDFDKFTHEQAVYGAESNGL